ncbi:toll/interleukin-1 receptor domain-containing protein [Clostridium sp. B9]|uniref:toll/interleukin-1 receptor domain-containing protein n=1 Tax=Clostridium sp. B9 TaxID=3423224 RepID=UPI003D2EA9AB
MVPKVFISYAHDTESFSDRILNFSNKLRENNIDANIDQYEESPPEGWARWMDNQIEDSDFVIIVCTKLYYDKFKMFKSTEGRGVNWEINIIYQHLYESCCNNTKFIPVIFNDYTTTKILKPLQSSTYYYVDREKDFKKLCNRLKGIKNTVKPPLGKSESEEYLKVKERKNLFITSFIDVKTWDNAKWRGISYLFFEDNKSLPVMGLLYQNRENAIKIFKEWKKVCKDNIFSELEISIIEKKNVGIKDGYFVYITTNMDECKKRAEKQGFDIDETVFSVYSRYQYMTIDIFKNNLAIFKKQLQDKKEFYIAPAIIDAYSENPTMNDINFDLSLKIKMNKIKFKDFDSLTPKDIEYDVVSNLEHFINK